jgi:hypothetical protein
MSEATVTRATVVLVGTLDTKGHEYAFLRDRIMARGVDVLLVDAGILGEPLTEPDVTRQEVAAAAGVNVQALADAGDRGAAIEVMGRGAAAIVLRLHAEGRFDAVGALGGTGGTTLATHAMRRLPVGVPKLMVSTVASGDTSPYHHLHGCPHRRSGQLPEHRSEPGAQRTADRQSIDGRPPGTWRANGRGRTMVRPRLFRSGWLTCRSGSRGYLR